MSGIKMEGDWSEFENHLEKMMNLNLQQMHAEIGEALLSSTQKRFEDEKDPSGKSWAKSLRATEESGQTLTDSARLKNSINYKARAEGVAVGTNVKYASVHQKGMQIKMKTTNKKTGITKDKIIPLPARPFLGISDDDMAEIKAIVSDCIKEALK